MYNTCDSRLFIQAKKKLFGCGVFKILINSSKNFPIFTQLSSYWQQKSENLSTILDFPFTSQDKTLVTTTMVCHSSSCVPLQRVTCDKNRSSKSVCLYLFSYTFERQGIWLNIGSRQYPWQPHSQGADIQQANQNTTDTSHPTSHLRYKKPGLLALARTVHAFAWLNIQLQHRKRDKEAFNTQMSFPVMYIWKTQLQYNLQSSMQ